MNRYRLARILIATSAALSITLTACSSSGGTSHPTAPITTGTAVAAGGITISSFAFSGTLTVAPGQKVTVTNKDNVAHTLTDKKTHLFDTGNIPANGGTGTFTAPTKPGTYPFGCTYHPEMAGTLTVT